MFFIVLLFKTDSYTVIHGKVLSHAGKVFEYKDIPSMNKELNINKSTPYTSGGRVFRSLGPPNQALKSKNRSLGNYELMTFL